MAGGCCFAFEDGPERRPPGITEALGEVVVPDPVGEPQVFHIDGVILMQRREGSLVVKVPSLPPHLPMLALELGDRRAAAMAALLPARHAALRVGKLFRR